MIIALVRQAFGGGSAGLSIDLASVSYNYDSTGSCAKHQVSMFYDSDAPAPVSISMLGTTPLVRLHHLFAVVVFARESADNSSQPCSGAVKALRGYNLNYQNDADTGQLQLSQVTMFGKDDTPERFINLPVATYSYGSVTPNNKLTYVTSQLFSSGLPSDFDKRFGLALTGAQTSHADIYGDDANGRSSITYTYNYTRQNILDVNGDGRADLLYYDFSETHTSKVKAAFNFPGPGGASQFTVGSSVNSGSFTNFTVTSSDPFNHSSEVYEQAIDFDGDGRLDYVNAHEVINGWAVYLNKPDAIDPKRTVWQRRLIDIRPIKQMLRETIGGDPGFLPLSRSMSVRNELRNHCWVWQRDAGGTLRSIPSLIGYRDGHCSGPQGQNSGAEGYGVIFRPTKTITEWELRDINGDGYPDLVYNASNVGSMIPDAVPPAPPSNPNTLDQFRQTQVEAVFDIVGSADVRALINVAGVHLKAGQDRVGDDDPNQPPAQHTVLVEGTSAFSAPITLDVGCGVSRLTSTSPDASGHRTTFQECGFDDVNGDGLADRVSQAIVSSPLGVDVARLGTGNLNAPFSNASIQLPGPLHRSETDVVAKTTGNDLGNFKPKTCPDSPPGGQSSVPYPNQTYQSRRTAGLRDLNGDGIPDYITTDSSGTWTVAMGTAVGFSTPKLIDAAFELSVETVGCFSDNPTAGTGLRTLRDGWRRRPRIGDPIQ